MTVIHVLMALLAAWRFTEIVTQDVIFNNPRRWWVARFAGKDYANFLICPRCVSVWAGSAATVVFYFLPFLNWPFAFSMLFLFYLHVAQLLNALSSVLQTKNARKITIYPDKGGMDAGGFDKEFVLQTLKSIVSNHK